MDIVTGALKKPIATIILVLGMLIFSVISIPKIPVDIFPGLNLPTIYIIESYGGMSAQQMEGFFSTRLQDQFLYVNGVRNIESKNIQGLTMIKLSFYEGTDMAEASAQVALQVNRAMKFFPPGALPPQVVRFDASSLPVGQLVFSAPGRSLKEIYDLAATRVRPMFSTVKGLSAPPPFGANSRSLLVNVDPAKLRSFGISPDDVVNAIAKSNVMSPSGNLRMNNTMYLTTINTLQKTVEEFSRIPLKSKPGATVYVSDVARVTDGMDMTVDYALVNGKRSVYIPVVKTADASTWQVVKDLKARIPEMQSLLPDDVRLSYEFDQSVFVANSVKSLIFEGALGALLTGLVVLLFLRDLRSSLVVIITIPVSILTAVLCLKLFGQTINIMTLSGLALAVGILVDQATVTIENIHQHLEMGKPKEEAIYDACKEIAFPLLLILLCILAVFAPAFIMTGIPRAMFLPLSLAIGFAMIISYILAQSLVPVISNWLLKEEKFRYKHGQLHAHAGEAMNEAEIRQVNEHLQHEREEPEKNDGFERTKLRFMKVLEGLMRRRALVISLYLAAVLGLSAFCYMTIGKDLMPRVNGSQFQIRLKAPDGTRLERTEALLKRTLAIIDTTVEHHVSMSSAYVGLIPSSYGTSNLYIFNTGTHEAVMQVQLDPKYKVNMDELKDVLRRNIATRLPGVRVSFEPIDMTEKIMSQGAATPIEVRVAGKDMNELAGYADSIVRKMRTIPYLRDVQIAQPLKFPVIDITIDRQKAAQWGVTVEEIAKSVTASTSSSRFTQKIQWLDERVAYTYQVQVQVPEYVMSTLDELKQIPLTKGSGRPILSDVAAFSTKETPGQYDRTGPRRFLTINANIHQTDLGTATADVQRILQGMGTPPKGVKTELLGLSALFNETMEGLQTGLLFAVLVIFLLLAANYQSPRLSLTVLITVPAVILGALLMLLAFGSTLNLQSYMGIIMSIGVSVANAILIVTNAEQLRLSYKDARRAAVTAAAIRLRPILMTSLAMIAGMVPMAAGMGEAGEQSAPLGRAVIGGLIASTLAALFILPLAFAAIQRKTKFESPSLWPGRKKEKFTAMQKIASILIAVVLLTSACGETKKPVDLSAGKHQQGQYELTAVTSRPLTSVVKLPGEFKPFETVAIYPKVTGFVKEIPVDMGTPVKKGQVLMTLEAPEVEQNLQAAKARLAQTQAIYLNSKDRYERIKKTAATPGAISPFELESAKSKMKADEATLEAEKANVATFETAKGYLTVTAPFDGIITERNIHSGALVGPDTKSDKPVLVLQQANRLRLVVYVPESLSGNVDEKGAVHYEINGKPGVLYHTRITRYAGAISTGMRSEAYEMDVNAANGTVKPGMFAEVQMALKADANAFVVPASTIVNSTTGKYLIGVNNHVTHFIPVKEGLRAHDSTEVFGNLTGDEKILLRPTVDMEEGMRLE
ncbi:efflux RND transporter permease subunit [Chitinophaga alhagiae]|uniref:efflux RND transporter permease subunit n=1 Tax=Chitinophaga alhagiae TaxID=2203219 RepID=UPI000E5B8142|nr:efflux RND transporter permease subunit [Chitinophaga alhagiae]